MFLQFYIKDIEGFKIASTRIENICDIYLSKDLDKVALSSNNGRYEYEFSDRDTTLKVYYAVLEAMQGKEVDLGDIGYVKAFKEAA